MSGRPTVRPGWSLRHRRGGWGHRCCRDSGTVSGPAGPPEVCGCGRRGRGPAVVPPRQTPRSPGTASRRRCGRGTGEYACPAAPAAVPPALWDGSHSCPEPVPGGWRETCRGVVPRPASSPPDAESGPGGLLHGLLHGTDGAMGIREYQNFHRHFLSGEVFWFSIEDGGRFCKFFAWIPGALSRMRKN